MAQLKHGDLCPLIGESCRQLECMWYTKVSGVHPQTGENVEEYGCAVAWIPFLQMDNTMHVNQAGAAIESLRNETVEKMSPTIPIKPLPTKPIQINGTDFDNS